MAARIREGATNATLAREFEASEASIRRFRKRHAINPDGISQAWTRVENDEAQGATESVPITDWDGVESVRRILTDPDTMLRQRGLDPDDWEITNLTPNMYEGPTSKATQAAGGPAKLTYYQTKFTCKKRKPLADMIMAPRTDGWVRPTVNMVKHLDGKQQTVVVIGDQQAPFHDTDLHAKFCEFLRQTQPARMVELGDTIDLPDIRPGHRQHRDHTASVNESLQSGYDINRGYVDAAPDMYIEMLWGNHCERLYNILADNQQAEVRNMLGIKRPDTPEAQGEELLTLEHAMRMDELGINVVNPAGSYTRAAILLTDKLAVRHGWIARKGSGSSALATLEHLGYNVIVGHTHRQAKVFKTVHEITQDIRTLVGIEAGCMCRVSQAPDEQGRVWPGYTDEPDWQQGFVVVDIWPDGFFQADLATYVNSVLLSRGQRY